MVFREMPRWEADERSESLRIKMATALQFGRKAGALLSPLTPELKDFIDRAIVPALVNQYLAEMNLAEPAAGMRLSGNSSTAVTLRGRRP